MTLLLFNIIVWGDNVAADKKTSSERLVYLDLLRIVSVVCMVMLHVSGTGMQAPIGSFDWHVCNIYDGITHFCVPVFVMISGAFLLDPQRDYTLKKLYKVKILRIITAFLFWSLVYAVIAAVKSNKPFGKLIVTDFVTSLLKGNFHLWFMFMIAGLYMLTPLLRKFTQDKKMTEYFLLLCGIFMFGLSNIELLSPWYEVDNIASYINEKFNMDFVFGYTFYYVAGFYFKQYSLSSKIKKLIYALGILSAVAIPLMTYYYSVAAGKNCFIFYAFQSPCMGLLSVMLFLLFKDAFSSANYSEKSLKCISFLSKNSFGVYLVHAAFVNAFGITCHSFNSVVSVPVLTAAVFAVSLALVWLISKIPVVNKYIM